MSDELDDRFTPIEDVKPEEVDTVEETTEDEKPTEEVVEEGKEGGEEKPAEDTTEEVKEGEERPTEETVVEDTTKEVVSEVETPSNVSELTDGAFDTVEDLIADRQSYIDNAITGDNLMETLNSKTEELFGMDFSEVVSFKNEDYNSWNDLDLIEESMKFEDPGITDIEIQVELEKFEVLNKTKDELDEMIEDEKITHKEVRALEAEMSRKARTAYNNIKEIQDSVDLSEIKLSAPKPEVEAVEELTQEQIDDNNRRIDASIEGFEGLKITLGSKDAEVELPIVPSDDEKSRLKEMVKSQQWLADRWKGDDGKIDESKALQDMYRLENWSKITSSIYNEGSVAGAKSTVKEEDNITLGERGLTPDTTKNSGMTEGQKIAAGM